MAVDHAPNAGGAGALRPQGCVDKSGLGSRWITAYGPARHHPTCAATPAGNDGCAPCTDMEQIPLRHLRRKRCGNTTSPGRCGRGRIVGRAGSRRVAPCGVIRPTRRHQQVTMVVHRAPCTDMAQTPWRPVHPTQAVRKHDVPRAAWTRAAVGRAGSRRVAPCGVIRPARRHQQATTGVHRAQTWHRPHGDPCIRRRRCGNTTSPGRAAGGGPWVALDHGVWPRAASSDLRGDTSRH